MKRFEVGNIYSCGSIWEVVKVTAKTVTFAKHYHYGRYNDGIAEVKTVKKIEWPCGEVALLHDHTIEAKHTCEA